jgi:hypothetical protein
MKTFTSAKIDQALTGYTYVLAHYLVFKISLFQKHWCLNQQHCTNDPIWLMSGRKIEPVYPTLAQAQQALQEVFDYYYTPLTQQEIRHWFKEKWIRREEEAIPLSDFKWALLDGKFGQARMIYNRFSSYTKEAIPEKVIFHLELTNV